MVDRQLEGAYYFLKGTLYPEAAQHHSTTVRTSDAGMGNMPFQH